MSEVMEQKESLPVAEQNTGLINMIEKVCMNPEMDVEKLERMLDMQERILDKQSQQQFQIDMALMQADLPVIEKNGNINAKLKNGVVMSTKFAKFEDINRAVLPVLQKYGFSFTFETQQAQGYVNVIGVLRHKSGHKESTQLQIPLDATGSKNAVQAVGSSVSYGKRYVMSALLNITTTDDDDDGQSAVPAIDLFAHNMVVQKHIDTIYEAKTMMANDHVYDAIDIMKENIPEVDQTALWVAPTKGGIFTTEERAKMQQPSKYDKGDK